MEHNDFVIVDIRGLVLGIVLHSAVCTQAYHYKRRYTLSHLLPHLNRIKQQQKRELTELGVQVLNSTVQRPQEVISMASTVQST